MNRLEIKNEARRVMAEKSTTASYADEEDLEKWINLGMKDMCSKGKVYERTVTATISDGVADYTLPWDFIDMSVILTNNKIPLDKITPDLRSRIFIISGKPLYFILAQTPITFSQRAPSTSYTTGQFLTLPTFNGYMYEVTVGGTTQAGAPPTYPTDEGATVTDGTCTLVCREYMRQIWSFTLLDTPTTIAGTVGLYILTYFALAQGLSDDTESPPFPVDTHHHLIPYICYRWAIKSRDAQLAAAFYQEYAAGIGIAPTKEGSKNA